MYLFLCIVTQKIFNRGSNPTSAKWKRPLSPRFTSTFKKSPRKRPSSARARIAPEWKENSIIHFLAPISTTSRRIAVEIGVNSVSHRSSWGCKRKFRILTSLEKVVQIIAVGHQFVWCSTQMIMFDIGLNSWFSPPRSLSDMKILSLHLWSILDRIRDHSEVSGPSVWRAVQWSVKVLDHFISIVMTQRL